MTNDEIQALCDAATPGPWEWCTLQSSIRCDVGWVGVVEHDQKGDGNFGDIEADGELMAASRMLVPELLAKLIKRDADALNLVLIIEKLSRKIGGLPE